MTIRQLLVRDGRWEPRITKVDDILIDFNAPGADELIAFGIGLKLLPEVRKWLKDGRGMTECTFFCTARRYTPAPGKG